MQIFALANICRSRINYKLEITGLMSFHAVAVDHAIGFLSDRHHKTTSIGQNPSHISTYLTSFSTRFLPFDLFNELFECIHYICMCFLILTEGIPASGCFQHHICWHSFQDNCNIAHGLRMSRCGCIAQRKPSDMRGGRELLVSMKQCSSQEVQEIPNKAFIQEDPKLKSIVTGNYF